MRILILVGIGVASFLLFFIPGYFLFVSNDESMDQVPTALDQSDIEPLPPPAFPETPGAEPNSG